MKTTEISQRKKSLSLLSSLAMPGLGHIYNGELFKGLCFFALFVTSPIILLKITSLLPDKLLLSGSIITFLIILSIYTLIVKSAVKSSQDKENGYLLKLYNRWYFYIALWLICMVIIGGNTLLFSQNYILQFCRVTTDSMKPALEYGDFLIVDRTAYKKISPSVGDIALFIYPDDRSKLYIKRIAGLPGDTIYLNSKAHIIVPHGHAYVLGDNRQNAVDSRTFGTIPLTELTGKARQVYFSLNNGKINWKRIGLVLK